jgi:hypothetical protein
MEDMPGVGEQGRSTGEDGETRRATDAARRRKTERSRPPVGRWEERFDRAVFAFGHVAAGPAGGGRARGILHIFGLVERLMEIGHTIRPLRAGGILRYEIARLPARTLPLADGTRVKRGQRVIVIHFDNRSIAAIAREVRGMHALTWRLVHEADGDLRELAALARSGALPPDVRAAWAEGLFARALARYGFRTRPAARTPRTPFARLFLLALLAIYAREGLGRLESTRLRHLRLEEAWIGLDALQGRFAFPADPAPRAKGRRARAE